jgi:hypothetical protein
MERTLLKSEHAYAVRNKDKAEVQRIEKELAKHGIIADWLTEDVLVWRESGEKKKRQSKAATPSGDCYPGKTCSVCGGPVQKTGKSGRPPTKCEEHR